MPAGQGLARPQPASWGMPLIYLHILLCWLWAHLARLQLVPYWIGSAVISGHGWYMDCPFACARVFSWSFYRTACVSRV